MSLAGILLGLINIAIVVAILLLVGAIIQWFCSWIGFAVPELVRKLYLVVVALIAPYMLIALLLGMQTWRIVQSHLEVGAVVAAPPSIIQPEAR
jgi:hypothetical protein